jgi:hypothetical protein
MVFLFVSLMSTHDVVISDLNSVHYSFFSDLTVSCSLVTSYTQILDVA